MTKVDMVNKRILDNQYRVVKSLGNGAFGDVYQVEDIYG